MVERGKPSASVVLTAPADADALAATLASCLHQSSCSYELILVEAALTSDRTGAVLRAYESRLPLRYFPRRPGDTLAKVQNRAARQAQGDVLVWVPEDAVLGCSFVEAHLRAHESSPADTLVIGRHASVLTRITPETPLEPEVALRIASHDPEWERTLLDERTLEIPLTAATIERDWMWLGPMLEQAELPDLLGSLAAAHGNDIDAHPMCWVFTTSRSMRAATFERAAGFDEQFESGAGGGPELHYRLARERSVRTRHAPLATSYRFEPALDEGTARAKKRILYRDLRHALAKHEGLDVALAVRLFFRRVGGIDVERLLRAVAEAPASALASELTRSTRRAAEADLVALIV